jgi:hypothetical protein
MAYDTKKLFRNAISNVAKDFGSLYSEGEEVPRRRRNEGDVEIDLPPSRLPFPDTRDTEKTKQGEKSLKKQIKEAFLEAGSEDYMRAYQKTLETLNAAQRNRPRFANAEKLLKENRTRMKDFVISKAYLKA